ncbi:DUF488 domain-containing protein [Fundidesulfovibrio putealis]|uniref:DUF488 domain-containing protein n=1 Tax=Fundidesulfovibrio putealis TaxID=270496 RepID=UPI00041E1C2A|nr:DUF488 domain-containing protein [Fundidesulfovibrio putealis]
MASPVDSAARAVILTIGHSNHPFEHFLGLLRRHAITAVADVRSRPYTKYAKHFCREPLERLLRAQSIPYVFLGDLIGGKPDDPALLGPDGKPDYALIAATPAFATGIERLITGASTHVIALMCGEEDPSCCHRHHLIAPALSARGLSVRHIRGDGRIEDDDALRRASESQAGPQQLLLL